VTSAPALVLVGATLVAPAVVRGARDVGALLGVAVARWRARRRWSRALDAVLVRVTTVGTR
jgi:hypothetical protein